RVDATIVFRALSKEEIAEIVDLEIKKVNERLAERAMSVTLSEAARTHLAEQGFDPDYGARPLRRLITSLVEDRLSDAILAGDVKLGSMVLVDYDAEKGELTFGEAQPEAPVGEPA
ncbi:MAG: ATP-dependent Clp protease ATP-binding subunit, partial [Chloroflexota bacterium]